MKTCSKCKLEKLETEFPKKKGARDGLNYQCKLCVSAYQQTDAYKAYQKAYWQTDEKKAIQKAYSQTDAYKAYQKAYKQTDDYKASQKAYKQTDVAKANRKAYIARRKEAASLLGASGGE